MHETARSALLCPVCGGALLVQGPAFACAAGHAFDLAREGYLNLLRTARSGDSGEMLIARRAFLDGGFYRPLADALGELVEAHLGQKIAAAILDAGCGEGYYLRQIAERLRGRAPKLHLDLVGLDSAKDAARMAARRQRDAFFVVADLQRGIPLQSAVLQAVLNIFAPRNLPEFARVLAPGGLLAIAIPAPDHLVELRETLDLLGMQDGKEGAIAAAMGDGFAPIGIRELRYTLRPGRVAIERLLHMTPNYRHPRRWAHLLAAIADDQPVTAAFTLLAYRRLEERPGAGIGGDR